MYSDKESAQHDNQVNNTQANAAKNEQVTRHQSSRSDKPLKEAKRQGAFSTISRVEKNGGTFRGSTTFGTPFLGDVPLGGPPLGSVPLGGERISKAELDRYTSIRELEAEVEARLSEKNRARSVAATEPLAIEPSESAVATVEPLVVEPNAPSIAEAIVSTKVERERIEEKSKPESPFLSAERAVEQQATEKTIADTVALELKAVAESEAEKSKERVADNTSHTATAHTSEEDKNEAKNLKSPTLKASVTLDELANGKGNTYKKGAKGKEVEHIQQALLKMGFDLGEHKDDGDFGQKTKDAITLFQENYKATNKTHLAYRVGKADGIVGQYTLLALDEALMEDWTQHGVQINHKFIGALEGSITTANVPDPKGSQSGVTIGSGFDLGARSLEDLTRLGLPDTLIDKFTPYLGAKKQAAEALLEKTPLTITEDELATLDELVKKSETDKIVALYNSSGSSYTFESLPPQAQTVIASVAYQFGYLPEETENFWQQAITQNWQAMYDNLMDFRDKYPTRRETEAKLIKELL